MPSEDASQKDLQKTRHLSLSHGGPHQGSEAESRLEARLGPPCTGLLHRAGLSAQEAHGGGGGEITDS